MKKLIVVALSLALLLAGCGSKPADFRNANWGDSPGKVASGEDGSLTAVIATDDYILYTGVIDDIDADVFYQFDDGKLIEAQVQFHITGTREHVLMDFVNHYIAFRDKLIEQYGPPLDDDYHIWLLTDEEIPIYEQDPYNQLMYYQRLEFKQEWITKDSYVSLTLNYRDLQENYYYYACDIALYESSGATLHG